MNQPVALLGADGFIGRHIAFALRARGYEVVAIARKVSALHAMGFQTIAADLTDPDWQSAAAWRDVLPQGCWVVNTAGLLTASESAFQAVHVTAPKALYQALGSNARGVLISAFGIEAQTDFAKWRRAGEETVPSHFAILRPGLVVADTSYGGTSLLRGLASLPWVTPVVGAGDQPVTPLHAEDLADLVVHCLEAPDLGEDLSGAPMTCGGAERVSLSQYASDLRSWMGLTPAREIHMPIGLVRFAGELGDMLRLGPVSSTVVDQLEQGVDAPLDPRLAGAPQPRGWSEIVQTRPAGSQDLWHARFYLLRPVLRLTLAFMWLISGILGLILPGHMFLSAFGPDFPSWLALAMARLGGIADLALAVALARNWRPEITGPAQLALVGAYTIGLTLLAPALWMLPFGGLLKNLPVFLVIVVWMVLERER